MIIYILNPGVSCGWGYLFYLMTQLWGYVLWRMLCIFTGPLCILESAFTWHAPWQFSITNTPQRSCRDSARGTRICMFLQNCSSKTFHLRVLLSSLFVQMNLINRMGSSVFTFLFFCMWHWITGCVLRWSYLFWAVVWLCTVNNVVFFTRLCFYVIYMQRLSCSLNPILVSAPPLPPAFLHQWAQLQGFCQRYQDLHASVKLWLKNIPPASIIV